MLRQLVVGLNGSEFSKAAMETAVSIAGRLQYSLVGVGVVDVPQLTAAEPVPLGGGSYKEHRDAEIVRTARQKLERVLAEFTARCQTAAIPHRTLILEGNPAELLIRESQCGDLLIVGKKHMPAEAWERESRTLEGLLRNASRPVLCVPRVLSGDGPVIVAYDGSWQAARTLQLFAHSGLGANRELHVVSIGDGAKYEVQLAADFLRSHGIAPQVRIEERVGAIAPRILEIARQQQAELLVLGCYGHSRLHELVFGSVTKTVLAETHVPMYLFH